MAAITLYNSRPGFIDRHGVGEDALDKTIDAMIKVYNQTPLQGAMFFRTVSAKGGTYKESGYGNDLPLPPKNEDSDALPFAVPSADFPKEITVDERRLAVQVERAYPEDQLHDIARKQMSGLLRVGRLAVEYQMADIWNNATTASGYDGGDGVSWANDSHPYRRLAQGTWDNLETASALTSATFSTARTNLRKRTDTRGYPNMLMVKLLVVPADLERKARELKTADKVSENALNQPWVFGSDDWIFKVYDYQTDTNAWTLVGGIPEENKGMIFVEKVRPNIAPTTGGDRSTDIIWGERLRMRTGAGHRVCYELQHNIGA